VLADPNNGVALATNRQTRKQQTRYQAREDERALFHALTEFGNRAKQERAHELIEGRTIIAEIERKTPWPIEAGT